jgi:glycosyltransferase involved in cell wall biosynthesis
LGVVGKPFSPGEMLMMRRLRLKDRVIYLGELSDTQLAHAYRKSLGFLFPSMQEGFGFPSLEAQWCGTPVLCSDIPVFREVCADAAIYFDPRMGESIGAAVQKLLDEKVREQLCIRGHKNVRRFTWDRCARESMAAFEEAARQRSAPPVPSG